MDAYCIFSEEKCSSLRDAGEIIGCAGSYLTHSFVKFIPGYYAKSKQRRSESKSNKAEALRKFKSRAFRFESEFSNYITESCLSSLGVEVGVRNRSAMEIDLVVDERFLVELKVTTRKVDLARALGQTMFNLKTFDGNAKAGIVCVPRRHKDRWRNGRAV
jgi:hypothetical protein